MCVVIKMLKNLESIDQYIAIIQSKAERVARATHGCYRDSLVENTASQIERINKINRKKEMLLIARNSLVDAVNNLDKNSRLLLLLYYIRKVERPKILRFFDISERTFYRWLEVAQNSLRLEMKKLGCDNEFFEELRIFFATN